MLDDKLILIGGAETAWEASGSPIPSNVSFRETGGAIHMNEEPAAALRARPDTSIAVAARMVGAREADAFFSAGSTGATVAAALLEVGRLKGCRRPAITTILPFDEPALLLDVGATVSCRPQDLLNFAILGSVFARKYIGLSEAPRVGLLNVGEEPGKGGYLAKEAHELLAASSAVEGVAHEILGMVRATVTSNVFTRLAGSVLRSRLLAVRDRVDPENYGGSFLLGVHGSVVIGHGNSRARGVENALLSISRAGASLVDESERALAAAREQTAGDKV